MASESSNNELIHYYNINIL